MANRPSQRGVSAADPIISFEEPTRLQKRFGARGRWVRMQYGRPPPQIRRTSSCLVCFLCNLMGNLRGCTSTPSPFSPPSCMEGVGWEHGELAWSLHASYPCSIPHPTPLPHLRHRPLCVSVMLSPYFSTFFERRKKGRSHMKLSFMAILIHCEHLLSYTNCFLHP